jgi:hypothetical protein
MAHIVEKNIHGGKYLYLYESVRSGDKVSKRFVRYLGKKADLMPDN